MVEMHGIEKIEASDEIRQAWKEIFAGIDPCEDSFQLTVEKKMLLYPLVAFYLNDDQYPAFISTLKELGESAFIISEVEWGDDFFERGANWLCKLPTDAEYCKIPHNLHTAIYSLKGTFGMLISDADHAIVGGTADFIDTFKKHYPKWEEDRKEILRDEDFPDKLAHELLAFTE